MPVLTFKAGSAPYPVIIRRGCLEAESFRPLIGKEKACILTDTHVAPLYGQKLAETLGAALIIVPAGEESKSWACAGSVLPQLVQEGISRSGTLIALGGGMPGDLGGFIAAVYLRGIACIQAPTTLLAQIDSSMGGKTGVNLPEGKNLAGAFHHPKAVLIDPDLLETMPPDDFTDGLAEMIKYGFIRDRSILDDLLAFSGIEELKRNIEPLIYKCCSIKQFVVEKDERDTGLRMTLNFGHTLGHAVEKGFGLSHGRSVALGMMMITCMAAEKKLVSSETATLLEHLLKKYGLPYDFSPYPVPSLLPYIGADKKNIEGKLHLVLCPRPGESILYPADLSFFGRLV